MRAKAPHYFRSVTLSGTSVLAAALACSLLSASPYMNVNYWILPFALLLLYFPRQWLRVSDKVSNRSPRVNISSRQLDLNQDVKSNSLRLITLFSKARNWIDLARAATGVLALNYACFSVELGEAKSSAYKIFALKCALLVLAVLIQTIRPKSRVRLVAPIFFILGLSFGLINWLPALFAFVAVWTCNRAIPSSKILPSPGVFLFTFAGFELCFGLLLARGRLDYLLLIAALAILPPLLSGMLQLPLVQINKPSRRNQR